MNRTITAGLAIAALAAAVPSVAQGTTTISAFVKDAEGQPIAEAQILLDYKGHVFQKYRTKTDETGKFVHVNVYTGPYDITVSKEGLGEVTFPDFYVRDLGVTEQPPTFTIGQKKVADPEVEAALAAEPEPEGPTAEEQAAAFASELDAANAALEAGDLDAAIATYGSLVEKAPELPLLHMNMGLALNRKGDKEAAEAAFRRVIELDPAMPGPHRALSIILYERGDTDGALEASIQAAANDPQDPVIHYNLGVLYANAGRSDEAQETFLKAEQLDPENPEIQFQLGTLAVAKGQTDAAIARLEKYLELAAEDAPNVAAAQGIVAALKR